jgi:hypothetical protein
MLPLPKRVPGSWIEVPARLAKDKANKTRCDLELECNFTQIRSLTHDIADAIFASTCLKASESVTRAAPLTVMSLVVTPTPPSAKTRPSPCPNKQRQHQSTVAASERASVETCAGERERTERARAENDPVGVIASCLAEVYENSKAARTVVFVADAGMPASRGHEQEWQGQARQAAAASEAGAGALEAYATDIRYFANEKQCLLAWMQWAVEEADADCWATFEAQRSLGYLQQRARLLGICFDCGRMLGAETVLRSVQSYNRSWSAQGKMASASLETFKADKMHGRVFLDLLRVVTVKHKDEFHTGSFAEIVARLLGRARKPSVCKVATCANDAQCILDLFFATTTLPDTIEMSRLTGLSLQVFLSPPPPALQQTQQTQQTPPQQQNLIVGHSLTSTLVWHQDILYKAEMVKVHSILLRVAHRHKRRYVLAAQHVGDQIREGPYKIDPRYPSFRSIARAPARVLAYLTAPFLLHAHQAVWLIQICTCTVGGGGVAGRQGRQGFIPEPKVLWWSATSKACTHPSSLRTTFAILPSAQTAVGEYPQAILTNGYRHPEAQQPQALLLANRARGFAKHMLSLACCLSSSKSCSQRYSSTSIAMNILSRFAATHASERVHKHDGLVVLRFNPSSHRLVCLHVHVGWDDDGWQRVAAKQALKSPALTEIERTQLDGRQRALKLCANAAYGFAGAAASPVQCVALAEAVLLHGAAMCRAAVDLAVDAACKLQRAHPCAQEAECADKPRVLYAQTDSIFLLLPNTCVDQAKRLGPLIAGACVRACVCIYVFVCVCACVCVCIRGM